MQMKNSFSGILVGLLALGSSGCVFVHVKGDLHDGFWDDGDGDDDGGFRELSAAVGDDLSDPQYDLSLGASPWHTDAEWTVRFADEGSNGHAAFVHAKEAVLQRISRKGGHVTEEHEDGPHVWTCGFHLDGDAGKASVRLVENARKGDRPNQLEVTWKKSD